MTMPTGLLLEDGELYAAAWSTASSFGLPPGRGEVVRIGAGSFASAGG